MKKSLSLLLAFALVFSMFSSLAFAADELSDEQKYEALKAAGIFAGMPDGSAGLDQKMTRAQFARVAGLLAGLDVDAKPTTKTFSDVAETHWAYEEIEAAAAAGLVEGMGDGTFNPSGNVTIQQLAVVAAKILKLDPVEDAKVEGAADWAAPYIQALLDKGIALPTNYKDEALRADLVNVSYEVAVNTGVIAPEKVSVVSAKPVGVKKVEVQLNKAVDTSKATLTLKRNNTTVATKTVWAENKKSATLELETSKIMEGDYTVILGGLDEDEIDQATATFKGENEKVVKLEFVAPSDTLPQAPKVLVQFRALNQYDEDVSLAAGSFTAYTSAPGGANVKKDANGNLYVELSTEHESLQPNISQISINVINTDSQISISKVFQLGNRPYVAKVELGEVTYSNGEGYLSKAGDKAVVELIQLDQYGHRITEDSKALFNATAHIIPYLQEFNEPQVIDDNNDRILDVVVTLKDNAKSTGEYTLTVFGGVSVSTTINVKATNYAATIEIDTSTVLAEGDKGKYLTIIAYDRDGNQLSAQDIVDNYEEGHFTVTASGNLEFETKATGTTDVLLASNKDESQFAVVKAGEHKGKLYIKSVGSKGLANIFVNITPTSVNGIMFNKNYQITIHDKRYPEGLRLKDANAVKAIPDANKPASSKMKIVAVDQYGEEFNGVVGKISEVSRTVTYDVYVEYLVDELGVVIKDDPDPAKGNVLKQGAYLDLAQVLGKDWYFIALAGQTSGEDKVKISLRKRAWDGTTAKEVLDDAVASVTRSMKIIDKNTRLTYTVKNIDTLFAAIDDKTYSGNPYDNVLTSKHARTVEIEAKDGAGDVVALPADYVIGVAGDAKIIDTDGIRRILGNKAGTTQLMVTYKMANGGSNTVYKEVTVKDDAIAVTSLSADAQYKNDFAAIDGANAAEIMNLKVKDNYNTEYTGADIQAYDKHLGIRYTVSDIQGSGTVTVDHTGKITLTGSVESFTLTANAPSGKTASTAVVVTP